jgi:hypothetical protein
MQKALREPQIMTELKITQQHSGLSEEDLNAIRAAVSDQIRAQFDKGCLCGLKPNALQEMGHFWGMMEDVSGGEPARSVETLRSVIKTQHRIEMASSKAMMAIVGAAAIAAFYGAVTGVKTVIEFFRG